MNSQPKKRKRRKLSPLVTGDQGASLSQIKPEIAVQATPAEVYYPQQQEPNVPFLGPEIFQNLLNPVMEAFANLNSQFDARMANAPTKTKIDIILKDGRTISATISDQGRAPTIQETVKQILAEQAPGATLNDISSSRIVSIGQATIPPPNPVCLPPADSHSYSGLY